MAIFARKAYGQHFLTDAKIAQRIANFAQIEGARLESTRFESTQPESTQPESTQPESTQPESTGLDGDQTESALTSTTLTSTTLTSTDKEALVIEIGPGRGILTRALLNAGARQLVIVEKDALLVDALHCEFSPRGVDIVSGDALRLAPWEWGEKGRRRILVSNLPYNVGTRLLGLWLPHLHRFERLVLMFQLEVARRLVAPTNSAEYGRLSVLTQLQGRVRIVMKLAPGAFSPPPKVDSALVVIEPRHTAPNPHYEAVARLTARGFSQRRAQLKKAFTKFYPMLLESSLARRRPQELSPETWQSLATMTGASLTGAETRLGAGNKEENHARTHTRNHKQNSAP